MDIILKSILRRQIPFLIGGTITGTIMTYYYGFLFAIVANSAIWYGISYLVNMLTSIIGKTKDLTTKNILFNMHSQRLIPRKGKLINVPCMQDICIANLSSSSAYFSKPCGLKSDDAFQS